MDYYYIDKYVKWKFFSLFLNKTPLAWYKLLDKWLQAQLGGGGGLWYLKFVITFIFLSIKVEIMLVVS